MSTKSIVLAIAWAGLALLHVASYNNINFRSEALYITGCLIMSLGHIVEG